MHHLLDVPSSRTTPPDILARLRLIDRDAECFYAGNGVWWLGVVKTPNKFRRATASRIIRRERRKTVPNWMALRQGMLGLQGFAFIAAYEQPFPDEAMVEDFRQRDWRWKYAETESAFHAGEAETELKQQAARVNAALQDKLHADKKRIFRRFVGNLFHAIRGR